MDQNVLKAFEAQCIQDEPPACQTACPIHVEARAFINLMAKGKFGEARKLLDRNMPLSSILGCICDGPCRASCRRAEIDQGIDMPMLERFCLGQTRQTKPFPLPGTGKLVSMAGSGLSSLVAAFELVKKGHSVNIYHPPGLLGGELRNVEEKRLSGRTIDEAVEMLESLRVRFIETPLSEFTPEWLEARLEDSLAIYLGLDDPALAQLSFGLEVVEENGPINNLSGNSVTLETSRSKVFAGGFSPAHLNGGKLSAINTALYGKKAFLSIDRSMQGVAPSMMREKEGSYPTKLFTNLSGIAAQKAIKAVNPLEPDAEEAQAEAKRCIQCQCLECVKNCAFLRHYKAYPKRYAREIYNNLAVVQGTRQANLLINSCAECGLCAKLCPLDADTGSFCGLARQEMVRTNKMPASLHEFALDDMCYSNGADIAFIRHQPVKNFSHYLFYPGCQLPASMPEETGAVYRHLCANLKGGVGFWFGCCGSPARWGARAKLSVKTAYAMRKSWKAMGKPEVILACASCAAQFAAELPEIPTRSLWEVLAELPLPKHIKPAPQELALHDPCPARDNEAMRKGIRKILKKLEQKLEELPLSGSLTRCCGYGGLLAQAHPQGGEAMSRDRASDTSNTLLSYCSMCRDRLALVGKPSLHALNLLFPRIGVDLEQAAARPAPGISERQHTRRLFRYKMLAGLWNEEPPKDDEMDKITLLVTDNLAPLLEKRRILHSDIKTVLLHPESEQFRNNSTGHVLASYRPKNVTFWVEYSLATDGSYVIHDAYTHRMTVPGVPAAPHNPQAIGDCCGDYGDGGFYRQSPKED